MQQINVQEENTTSSKPKNINSSASFDILTISLQIQTQFGDKEIDQMTQHAIQMVGSASAAVESLEPERLGQNDVENKWNNDKAGWWLSHPSEKNVLVSWDDHSQLIRRHI